MKIQNMYLVLTGLCFKQSFVYKGSFNFYRFFCQLFVNWKNFSIQIYTQIYQLDFFWEDGGLRASKTTSPLGVIKQKEMKNNKGRKVKTFQVFV